jgi:hypothetical protein
MMDGAPGRARDATGTDTFDDTESPCTSKRKHATSRMKSPAELVQRHSWRHLGN